MAAAVALFATAIGVLTYNFGYVGGPDLPPVSYSDLQPKQVDNAGCRRIRAELDKVPLIGEGSGNGRIVVQGQLWSQVPAEIQTAIKSCFARPDMDPEDVEVIVQGVGPS